MSGSEKTKLVDSVIDRFRDGDFNWESKAIAYLRKISVNISNADISEILRGVKDSPDFFI